MNPVHPMTYDVVKVQQHEQLARLERQRNALNQATPAASESPTQRTPRILPRRVATAAATALLMLSLIAGAVFAAATAPGAAPGGGQDIPAGGGGGGVHLLR